MPDTRSLGEYVADHMESTYPLVYEFLKEKWLEINPEYKEQFMTGPVEHHSRAHFGSSAARISDEASVGVAFSPTVEQRLRDLSSKRAYGRQNYGDNYKDGGKILMALFPQGMVVQTEEEANRLVLIVHMLTKLDRYAKNLKAGGHADSLDDLAVYAMLARDCDEIARIQRESKK